MNHPNEENEPLNGTDFFDAYFSSCEEGRKKPDNLTLMILVTHFDDIVEQRNILLAAEVISMDDEEFPDAATYFTLLLDHQKGNIPKAELTDEDMSQAASRYRQRLRAKQKKFGLRDTASNDLALQDKITKAVDAIESGNVPTVTCAKCGTRNYAYAVKCMNCHHPIAGN